MNSIWNDPDCVVRAGRVLEAVLPGLIELHTVFFQELGVTHVTDHCADAATYSLHFSDHIIDKAKVGINIKVVEYWHLKGRHHSPHHEHLGTLKCESCVNKMFDQE